MLAAKALHYDHKHLSFLLLRSQIQKFFFYSQPTCIIIILCDPDIIFVDAPLKNRYLKFNDHGLSCISMPVSICQCFSILIYSIV